MLLRMNMKQTVIKRKWRTASEASSLYSISCGEWWDGIWYFKLLPFLVPNLKYVRIIASQFGLFLSLGIGLWPSKRSPTLGNQYFILVGFSFIVTFFVVEKPILLLSWFWVCHEGPRLAYRNILCPLELFLSKYPKLIFAYVPPSPRL